MRALCFASDRWTSAKTPAPIAASRRTPTPTSRPFRRRLARRWRASSRSLSALLSPQELPLELVQLLLAARCPVDGGGQPGAPVQLRSVPVGRLPALRTLSQVLSELAALQVLREPLLEPRPLPEQRFVRDLDGAVMRREQPVVREALDDRWRAPGHAADPAPREEPSAARAPPPPRCSTRRMKSRRAAERSSSVRFSYELSARRATAPRTPPRLCERLELEPAVAARHPQLDQRGREQRQPARLVADLGHESLARATTRPGFRLCGPAARRRAGAHRRSSGRPAPGWRRATRRARDTPRTRPRSRPAGEDDDSSFRIAGRGDEPLDEPAALILVRDTS